VNPDAHALEKDPARARDLGAMSQPELGGNQIVLNATKQAPAPQATK
jgi:hypothetical protein